MPDSYVTGLSGMSYCNQTPFPPREGHETMELHVVQRNTNSVVNDVSISYRRWRLLQNSASPLVVET